MNVSSWHVSGVHFQMILQIGDDRFPAGSWSRPVTPLEENAMHSYLSRHSECLPWGTPSSFQTPSTHFQRIVVVN